MKREILYQKIAGTIAWQIKTGIWKAGEKLPSLRTISNEYGVSLNTAIQVYYELEKEGYVAVRGKIPRPYWETKFYGCSQRAV